MARQPALTSQMKGVAQWSDFLRSGWGLGRSVYALDTGIIYSADLKCSMLKHLSAATD